MFRGANSRGLSSLSNGISSVSDLPPLNPSSGTVYQPPNSAGSKNALIETQRMRTVIMGQIQAVQSDQDRQMQQSEARMSMVLRELSPKIQNLDRHNSFNQQQLDDLIERLSQLDSVVIPSIQQKCDEVQLKFEQSIRTETQSKFKPISDDIKHEQTKSEQLSDSATSHISNTNDKLNDLLLLYDELDRQSTETNSNIQSRIVNINPRISSVEARLAAYESQVENSIRNQSSQSDFQLSTKKLRKDLEDLEIDGIPLVVQSAASDNLASITSISSQIEQKFTTSKLSLSNMDNTIKMTTEQQKNVDTQVESLSKSSIDIQTSIEQEEQEINNKLVSLENSIKLINDEITEKLNALQDDNSGGSQLVLNVLNNDIQSLQSSAKQVLTQLNQDWNRFYNDNNEAQKITDSKISKLSDILNSEFSILKKIAAAEKRSKWCLNRIQVWQREVEESERLKVDDQSLIQKLELLENQLNDAESRLAEIDKQKAPKNKKLKLETYSEGGPVPSLALNGKEIQPLSIPPDLKLTYDENDVEVVLADIPQNDDKKENDDVKQDDIIEIDDAEEEEKKSKKKKTKTLAAPVAEVKKDEKKEEEEKKEEIPKEEKENKEEIQKEEEEKKEEIQKEEEEKKEEIQKEEEEKKEEIQKEEEEKKEEIQKEEEEKKEENAKEEEEEQKEEKEKTETQKEEEEKGETKKEDEEKDNKKKKEEEEDSDEKKETKSANEEKKEDDDEKEPKNEK